MRKARVALAAAALATATLGIATPPAQARGDGWEKVPAGVSYESVNCGTTLTVAEAVNREWQRFTTDSDGTVHIQNTGAYKVLITAEDGRSVLVNASGPSFSTLDAAGVFTYDARGLTILGLDPASAQELGLPLNAVLSGPFTVRVNADGTETLVRAPAHIRDVCELLR